MFLRFKPNPYTQGKVSKQFIWLSFPKRAYERRFYENRNLVALLLLATVFPWQIQTGIHLIPHIRAILLISLLYYSTHLIPHIRA